MKEELKITSNSLEDIINWLKNGYIVCIYSYKKQLLYFSREILDQIVDEKIIYINLNVDPTLLNADEWPWYIKNSGFTPFLI